jgi:hypothetical protein
MESNLRNPESMQEFYEGREVHEISEIEIEMKKLIDDFHKEMDELIKRFPIDE